MAADALPCIVCGMPLRNVFEDVTNQPSDGVVATTHGNYGSAAFDPMDGNFLEFNVCDACLVRAGEQGRVYTARIVRPVVLERICQIGVERTPYRPVLWTKQTPLLDSVLYLGLEDLDDLPGGVKIDVGEEVLSYVAERVAEQEGARRE